MKIKNSTNLKNISKLILLISFISIGLLTFTFAKSSDIEIKDAVYLGVKNYGYLEKSDDLSSLQSFVHKFFVDGKIVEFGISDDFVNEKGELYFPLENKLQEGYVYKIKISNNEIVDLRLRDENGEDFVLGYISSLDRDSNFKIDDKVIGLNSDTKFYKINWIPGGSTIDEVNESQIINNTAKVVLDDYGKAKEVYLTFISKGYTPPLNNVAGLKTLKNFLATSLRPCGTVLYMYGGTWDWQDVNSSNQARTIGLSKSWIDFFDYNNENYTYRLDDENLAATDYYPHGSWNQYYYAGIDCSGYVGWAVYNTINTQDGKEGYVMSATKMAKTFAEKGWGTWTQDYKIPINNETSDFKVGDIFSMNGHVWICLGTCKDGSIVILHSTPSNSRSGNPGGGVQLSALGYDKNCDAYKLVSEYMYKYFPKWTDRYEPVLKNIEDYTKIKGSNAGKFSWNLNNGFLSDPDNYSDLRPDQILKDLFDEDMAYRNENKIDFHYMSHSDRDNSKDAMPVKAVVPVQDTLWYIFTIDKYIYQEVRNKVSTDQEMDVTPVIRNNRTMLPLRYVAEALKADVKWDAATRTATFTKDGLTATIQIDDNKIVLSNGKTIEMDVKPLNINSRILVPVVNVANVFGLTNGNTLDGEDQDIEWDADTRTATIYIKR